MASSSLYLLLLSLAATHGYSAEEVTVNSVADASHEMKLNITADVLQECSKPQIQEAMREYFVNGDWDQMCRSLDAALNHSSEIYRQMEEVYGATYPLYWIGMYGHTKLASLLMCLGLHVDSQDRDGDTMLHGAAEGWQVQMVRMLLDHGAQVDARGRDKCTPYILAIRSGRHDVAEMLVRAGANVNARDSSGMLANHGSQGGSIRTYVRNPDDTFVQV